MRVKKDPSASFVGEKTKIPPCRQACPAGIDVPRYIRHIGNRDFDGALAVIREKIPFPAVCGYACVHPCEAVCARRQYDQAVAIRMLKRAAEEHSRGQTLQTQQMQATGKKVAVVGSGPCGLTAAYYLACLGHDVTVFEALSMAGGMLRYGIPEYRLPNQVVDREIEMIRSCGVHIKTRMPVSSAAELRLKGFDAVLIASGAWRPLKMGLEGEDSSMVIDGLRFLREVNSGQRRSIGRSVVVVGGGNTAVDAARASVRTGAETVMIYRRSREDMPALAEEVLEAEEEGVRISFMTMPIRVAEGSVVCMKTASGPVDESGRRRPVPVAGSEFPLSCDTVIMAIGQTADAGAVQLEKNTDGTATVDGVLATPVKGVFAAGDAVSGPKSIIDAIAQGRLASVSIDRYLGGEGVIDPKPLPGAYSEHPEPVPVAVHRHEAEKLPARTRIKGFDLIESGFDETTAVREARRCLACDIHRYAVVLNSVLCKGCGYCMEICHMGVFSTSNAFNAGGYQPLVVKNPDNCVGCLKCVYVCPDLAITLSKG